MAQGDYLIQNQSFPSFRSDLNDTLEAINTSNSGTSRPSSAVAGTVWLDTTSATTPTLKFYDGTDDISLATLDYTANTVNWLDSSVVADLVNDTTPQLGGDLDINGNSLVSVSNGNITFTPDGTGKVIIDGLSYPTADGTADQVLTTDGSGNLSFADASGGGTQWQSTIVTGTTLTAVAGNGYWINTTSNACTITLPASASVGDELIFVDYARTWGTNAVTINQNSLKFQGYTSPNPVYNTNGQSVDLIYSGATQGWIPNSDDDVTDEVIQTMTTDFLVIAGGGAGGQDTAGGGGAGGYRNSYNSETSGGGGSSETALELSLGTVYTITVGGGASANPGSPSRTGGDGNDSIISGSDITDITSAGGGGGAGGGGVDANPGGSGGGGGGTTGTGGSGTANQGFNGANGGAGYAGAGGGAGEAGDTDGDGYGGDGLSSSITGSAVTRGGGGAGCDYPATNTPGGDGGGGNTTNPTGNGGNGTTNTGSGGGGGALSDPRNGGAGGSGVVILRMADADYSGTTTGSPTVATGVSGKTVLTFTGSGSYTG